MLPSPRNMGIINMWTLPAMVARITKRRTCSRKRTSVHHMLIENNSEIIQNIPNNMCNISRQQLSYAIKCMPYGVNAIYITVYTNLSEKTLTK